MELPAGWTQPHSLQIETSEFCPAHCGFCLHSQMSRDPKALMPVELFGRILDEAATWPQNPRILPFGIAEPFADKRMPDLCRMVNEKLPTADLTFFTLGVMFTDKLLPRLEGISNWADCFISLHHSDPLAYLAETGLDFDKTLAAIDRLLAWNERTKTIGKVWLLRVTDGDAEKDRRFVEFVEQRFPGVAHVWSHLWNWAGQTQGSLDVEKTLDQVCGRTFMLHVNTEGKTGRCCLDNKFEHGFGTLYQDGTMLELFNTPEAQFLRSHVKRECGHPCDSCNMLRG